MHFEQSAILTVNSHVITRNPRITVSHDKHRTWFLHINNVQQEDRGRYMCQINTITAKTQIGYLNVVGKSCLLWNVHKCITYYIKKYWNYKLLDKNWIKISWVKRLKKLKLIKLIDFININIMLFFYKFLNIV